MRGAMRRRGRLVSLRTVPMRGIRMGLGAVVMPLFVLMRRFEMMMCRGVVVRRRLMMMGGCRMHLGLGHCGILRRR